MKAALRIVLLCSLAGLVTSACAWWDGPERQIRRSLDAIADRLSHEQPLSGLAAAAEAAGLQQYLSPAVAIEAGSPFAPITSRDAVIAAAARLIGSTPSLRVEFADVHVTFGSDTGMGHLAEVTCNVTADVGDRAGQQTRDARELSLTMREVDGRWVVERVKALSVLEPVS